MAADGSAPPRQLPADGGDAIPAGKEPPRRITGLQYRLDNVGFVTDRRSHLFVVDLGADEPRAVQLTDGDWDDTDPAWRPDSGSLAFVSRRHEAILDWFGRYV